MGKRSKSYYRACANGAKKPRHHLEYQLKPGLKGFLITTDRRDKETAFEAYSLFGQFADQLYGPEILQDADPNTDADEDVEDLVKKEAQAMSKKQLRRFQCSFSGTHGCLFIQTTLDDPTPLVDHILNDLHTTKTPKSRYIIKLFPVQTTCYADVTTISQKAQQLISEYFAKEEKSHLLTVAVRVRNNTGLEEKGVTESVVDSLREIRPDLLTLDLKSTDLVLSVYVLKTTCCLSILKDFLKYRKYNLQEIVTERVEASQKYEKDSKISNEVEVMSERISENQGSHADGNGSTTSNEVGEKSESIGENHASLTDENSRITSYEVDEKSESIGEIEDTVASENVSKTAKDVEVCENENPLESLLK